MSTSDVVSDGVKLIQRFLSAQAELARCKQSVTACEVQLSNAEAALGRWLAPPDMKPDEKIGVWMGASLFQVELVQTRVHPVGEGDPLVSHEYKVTVRSRGKDHWRLEQRA